MVDQGVNISEKHYIAAIMIEGKSIAKYIIEIESQGQMTADRVVRE